MKAKNKLSQATPGDRRHHQGGYTEISTHVPATDLAGGPTIRLSDGLKLQSTLALLMALAISVIMSSSLVARGFLALPNPAFDAPFDSVKVISGDGNVLGGFALTRLGSRPCLWTWDEAHPMVIEESGNDAGVKHLSHDGQVVLGTAGTPSRLFRWTSAGGVQWLDHPDQTVDPYSVVLSQDGSVVFGRFYGPFDSGEIWRWTETEGFIVLGSAPGTSSIRLTDCSWNGSALVGSAVDAQYASHLRTIWRWTANTGFQTLTVSARDGFHNDYSFPRVSEDGSVVVFMTFFGQNQSIVQRWTTAGTIQTIPLPTDALGIRGTGISADGQTIVGVSTSAAGQEFFRWTASGGTETIGMPPGVTANSFGSYSPFAKASADGATVLGTYNNNGIVVWRWTPSAGYFIYPSNDSRKSGPPVVSRDASAVAGNWWTGRVWRWSVGPGFLNHQPLPESRRSTATHISADGTTVLGQSQSENGSKLWRWKPSQGYTLLEPPASGHVEGANPMISANGKVVAGLAARSVQGVRTLVVWRWSESEGMEVLGVPAADPCREVEAGTQVVQHLSLDGSAIVLTYETDNCAGSRTFYWRRDTGFVDLSSVFGFGGALHISPDGSEVLGTAHIESEYQWQLIRWTAGGGVQTTGLVVRDSRTFSANGQFNAGVDFDQVQSRLYRANLAGSGTEGLGELPGHEYGQTQYLLSPMRITNDGKTIVGYASHQTGTEPTVNWRWTEQTVSTWLAEDFSPATDGWNPSFAEPHRISADGMTVVGWAVPSPSYRSQGYIASYRPVIDRLWPSDGVSGYGDMALTVYGLGFEPGSVVEFGGLDLDTTYVDMTRLDATIPESALATSGDFSVVSVRVRCPDGEISSQAAFTVVNPDLDEVWGQTQAEVVEPGESASVEVLPTDPDSAGISANLVNGSGTEPATVLVATYIENPTPTSTFDAGGGYVDLQVTGVSADAQLTAYFYYPSSITGDAEAELVLMYFDGANWVTVLSSGGTPPVQDTEQKRFTVVFDSTSRPAITELSGTIFGVADGAPAILRLTASSEPAPVGSLSVVEVEYSSPSTATVLIDWGDGTVSVADETAPGLAQAVHAYGIPGVFTVSVTITDLQGRIAELAHRFVVIYDPNGGFVTGGGWIDSPPGAYPTHPTLAGRATFGFTSKYQKRKTVPSGDTQFQFQAAGFRFHSTAYEWLVVSGPKAQYKGVGKVNGAGDYGFLLTATDGQVNGGGGIDKFRIKIWDRVSDTVVYDNLMGQSDDLNSANPQVLGGGSIVIHQAK